MKSFTAAASLAFVSSAAARTFTVYNACPFTIWPAIFTDLNVGSATPNQPTGWEAGAYTAVSFSVPDNWSSGRIWARRDCDFSSNPGPNSCLDGGCNGGLLCDPHTGTGVPPATLAEWTLGVNGAPDYYDISLVDGYNLPAAITNNVGCHEASCGVDLGPNCPAPLKGPYDSTGFPVGCKSACDANLSGDPSNSPNCCSGQYDTPATCPPSGVAYYSYFKDNCPDSYVYAYDESSGTALWTCDSGLNADYTLTFCPGTNGATVIAVSSSNAPVSIPSLTPSGTYSTNPSTNSGPSSTSTGRTTSSARRKKKEPNAIIWKWILVLMSALGLMATNI